MPSISLALTLMGLLLSVAACSSSSGMPPSQAATEVLVDDQAGTEPLPGVLLLLKAEDNLISAVPEIAHTQTMADSGLQISYTDPDLRARATPASIELQWMFMQECVQQTGVAPLVIVRSGLAEPFTRADDVVRNEQLSATEITSVPVASASTLHGAVIQVSATDFDGSLGTPLFNLRSIMGRYLWLSANLPERDYPFQCARQQPL